MKKSIGAALGLSLFIGVAAVPAESHAARPAVAIEKDLLGVRILQSYREVLARYGAPTRIYRATETVRYTEAMNLKGEPTGGILNVQDASASNSGSPGGGDVPGGPMAPGSGGAAAPSAAGKNDNPDASYAEAGGFTWVYYFQNKELAYEFHFNRDGRVEIIVELGRGFGQHTSRGIGLGDTVDKVYNIYGWTDRVKEEETSKFSLLYNDKYHAHFLLLKNRVIGISVFLRENQYMRFESGEKNGGGSGPGGSPGGSSGGPPSKGAAPSRSE